MENNPSPTSGLISDQKKQKIPNSEPISKIYLDALQELIVPAPSVKFGRFKSMDLFLGGFRPREFTILCGSTGIGKTTLLANWSAALLEQDERHLIMSVETGHTDFVKRTMSIFLGEDINSGESIPVERLKNFDSKYGQHFRASKAYFGLYEDRVPVEVLLQEIVYHAKILGCRVAFIDNLNFFMEVTRASDSIVEMDRVIHELIILCKQLDVHIVMVMHPNKSGSPGSTRVESEYGIKGSSTAVQEAHNVILFNRVRPEYIQAGKAEKNDRELKFAKMRRRGQYVGRTIILGNEGTRYIEKGIILP